MKISMPSSLRSNAGDPSIPAPVAAPGTEPAPGTGPLWATEPTSAAPAPRLTTDQSAAAQLMPGDSPVTAVVTVLLPAVLYNRQVTNPFARRTT